MALILSRDENSEIKLILKNSLKFLGTICFSEDLKFAELVK